MNNLQVGGWVRLPAQVRQLVEVVRHVAHCRAHTILYQNMIIISVNTNIYWLYQHMSW